MRTIGEHKTLIPAIGVGCMGIGGYFTADTTTDAETVQTLQYAFDIGLTLVDTAEGYAAGHSEELVGKAIAGRRAEIFVATKVSPAHLARKDLFAAVDQSLKRLAIEQIDLLQVHWPNPKIPLEETMGALDALVHSGRVRYLGLCNFTLEEIRDAQGFLGKRKIGAVQVEYNLFDRSIEKEYLPFCRSQEIIVIAYSPLDQGQICGGPRKRSLLEPIARHANCTLSQLALSWIVSHPGVVAIPKASQRDHVMQNAESGDAVLSESDISEIDRITENSLIEVPVHRVRAVLDDAAQRTVYRTVEEARANVHGFVPSPIELAEGIRRGRFLKAVRVRPTNDPKSGYDYDLIEGRIRFWAWAIAFEGQRDIPVLVRE